MHLLTDSQIAVVLAEQNEIKPTKSNVNLIREAIENKVYLPVNSLISLRESSRNILIPGKIDYTLLDGSVVAIDVSTNIVINNIIEKNELFEETKEMIKSNKLFVLIANRLIKDYNGD